MREIKFRVWDKQKSKMMYPDDYEVISSDFTQIEWDWQWEYYDKNLDLLEDGVIMQYTGLKDKNGKEIYEGDIVNHWRLESDWFISIPSMIVKWNDSGLNYNIWDTQPGERWEVIGNIYENPELLKEKI